MGVSHVLPMSQFGALPGRQPAVGHGPVVHVPNVMLFPDQRMGFCTRQLAAVNSLVNPVGLKYMSMTWTVRQRTAAPYETNQTGRGNRYHYCFHLRAPFIGSFDS